MVKRTGLGLGFTLVEILIVVIILGILAAIVIPQFSEASNEARQSSVRSDLQTVRAQIELYKIQHLDQDPQEQAVANGGLGDSAGFWGQMTNRTDADGTINAAGKLGPYLQQEPTNPFAAGGIVVDVTNIQPDS
ncbi:MAG: prepilin-type N-terminal cleavage/methylation domain-containing protein, partial [Planctomycetes bacterium]|nr:prepilin-type N-terminal cleavage/methylation domain-containing protein [Planctomycetota bacterium]